MTSYLIKKSINLFFTLFLVSLVIYSVLFYIPGDPAQLILGINATPETLANLRADLGLDKSFWNRYANWIYSLLTGEGSRSLNYDVPVYDLLFSSLTVTGPLALISIIFSIVISVPLGIYAARRRGEAPDASIMLFTQIGLAVPEFWFGLILILIFSVKLGLFSAGGFPGWNISFWGSLKALMLPSFALGFIRAAILARITRSSMLEVLGEDYIRTARSKGLKERTVIYIHALKNASIPIITILGLQFGQLLTGAIIIENVYFLPGLGRLVFQAIGQRDLPVVREVVLFMAGAIVIVNFAVDLACAALDPRLRKNSFF